VKAFAWWRDEPTLLEQAKATMLEADDLFGRHRAWDAEVVRLLQSTYIDPRMQVAAPRRPCRHEGCEHRVDLHREGAGQGCSVDGCLCLDTPELASRSRRGD